eukprot:TRINITY_DN19841_c0_g2_i2.p1 TRINITY_DN19841_c0_g2~~TRINITY_DN19841_c0_g2_i2.p1  ORF type:complete len:363 (+),score=63.43 TRINITY_DN19841_c0_g2_i2:191-1279(+)
MSSAVFSRNSLEHAMAGSSGSVLSALLLFPLDRLKTIVQVAPASQRLRLVDAFLRILRQEGLSGLYRGCSITLQTVGASNFLYFFLFEGLKERFAFLARRRRDEVGAYETLAASAAAGALNMLATEPLWRACVVLQAQQKPPSSRAKSSTGGTASEDSCDNAAKKCGKDVILPSVGKLHPAASLGLVGTVRKMWLEEGPGALWRGIGSSLWLVSNPVVQFFVYDVLKAAFARNVDEIAPSEAFVMGAIAKALATVSTFPLQVAQSRLRAGQEGSGNGSVKSSPNAVAGMLPCLRAVVAENGLGGLYVGLVPKLLQSVANAAFMFVFYEQMHAAIRQALRNRGVKRLARRMGRMTRFALRLPL